MAFELVYSERLRRDREAQVRGIIFTKQCDDCGALMRSPTSDPSAIVTCNTCDGWFELMDE